MALGSTPVQRGPNRGYTLAPKQFADLLAVEPAPLICADRHGQGGIESGGEQLRLRIGAGLPAGPAAEVGLAGHEKLPESLRPTEGVAVLQEFQDRGRSQLESAVSEAMPPRRQLREMPEVRGNAQALGKTPDERGAALLVADVPWPELGRSRGLAEVVHQGCEPDPRAVGQSCCLAHDVKHVFARIHFRVPALGLRDAPQGVDLRIDPGQRPARAQDLQEGIRPRLAEGPVRFLPHPLGHQGVDFPGADHLAHQVVRLPRYAETEIGEAGREPGHAQYPDGILGESRGYVPQAPVLEVLQAAIGIHETAIAVPCHRVDGQVASPKVFLERDIRREVHFEAAVPGAGLALRPRKRVLLRGLRVQEHRKVPADCAEAAAFQFGGRRPDDDPVTFPRRNAEQVVPNGAADQIDFHARMLPEARHRADGRPCLRTVWTLLACLPLTGCYLAHLAQGQLDLNDRREPIEDVLARPDIAPEVRARLEYIQGLRRFAITEAGMRDKGSYTSFVELDRPYVLWNVFAAAEFSVEPRKSCFPIAGCVSYRGYFKEREARDYANKLRDRGYDVYVAPVAAYSTLGRFKDPVLSTMLRYDDVTLAALIFHELAHQAMYDPGDSAFSEAFATVVEYEVTRRWLESQERAEDVVAYRASRKRLEQVAALMAETRGRLAALYASDLPVRAMRAVKEAEFALLLDEYADLRQSWPEGANTDDFMSIELNNARLAAISTYHECVPALQSLLADLDYDLPAFYRFARRLARVPQKERSPVLCGGYSAPRGPAEAPEGTAIALEDDVREERVERPWPKAEAGKSVPGAYAVDRQ